VKLATEPSRTDPLTAYPLTRVLPDNTLNGKLTPTTRRLKSARSSSMPEPRPDGRSLRSIATLGPTWEQIAVWRILQMTDVCRGVWARSELSEAVSTGPLCR